MQDAFTFDVHLDAKAFRSFAIFDVLGLKRRAKAPILFAIIMLFFSTLCFILQNDENQGVLLGVVLLIVGIGMPAVYFGMYLNSVQRQIKRFGLDKPKFIYTVVFSDNDKAGITVRNASKKESQYSWAKIYGIYKSAGNVFVYVAINQSYILPKAQVEGKLEVLRALFVRKVPADKLHI